MLCSVAISARCSGLNSSAQRRAVSRSPPVIGKGAPKKRRRFSSRPLRGMEYVPQPWSGTDAVARYSAAPTPSTKSADWAPIFLRRASRAARMASRNPAAWREASTSAVIISASGDGGRSSPCTPPEKRSKNRPMPWRADSHIDPGSLRMATRGDSRVARHAGKSEDASAMPATMAAHNTKGRMPGLPVWNSRVSSQVAATAAMPPMTTPYAAMRRPEPVTRYSRSRLVAPSAMRVPISTVRWRTE